MPCAKQAQLPRYIFLAFYSLIITPQLIDQRLTVFTDPTSTFIIALNSNTSRLTTFWAHQHHVRDINRRFELDATRVEVATSLRLHLFLMFGANVHTLNHYTSIF